MNKAKKRVALRKALSERIKAGDVLVVPEFAVTEAKTKKFVALLMTVSPEQKTLVIGKSFDEATLRASRNVPKSRLISSGEVNTEHMLAFRKIIITNDALAQLAERIAK